MLVPSALQAARTEVAPDSQAPDFQNKTFLLHLPTQLRGSEAPAGGHPVPALKCQLLALPLQESLPRPLTPGGTEQQDLLAEGFFKLTGRGLLLLLRTHTVWFIVDDPPPSMPAGLAGCLHASLSAQTPPVLARSPDVCAAGSTADRLLQNEQVPVTVVLQPLPHQDAGKGRNAGKAAAAEHRGKQVRCQGDGLASAGMKQPCCGLSGRTSKHPSKACTAMPGASKSVQG